MLTLPSSAAGPSHRSEQLIDFVLERKDGQDEPLICSVKVNFIYSEQLVKEHNILVVFPTRKVIGRCLSPSKLPIHVLFSLIISVNLCYIGISIEYNPFIVQ